MPYTFDPLFAADPDNPAMVAKNAAVLIFDPAVPNVAITITDVTGSPIPNPITVNAAGFGPAFQHATLDRVGWSGGGFENYITSYEGMKQVATDAKTAAQAAANLVGAPADDAMAAAINGSGTATRGALNATYATPSTVDAKVSTAQRWDPERFIYASPTALQKWRAAKANARGSGFARLSIYGDSVTQNNAASDTASPKYLNSYPWHLRTLLNKDYGDAGTGVVFPISSSLPDDNRWTFTGSFATASAFGPFGSTARNSPTFGHELTFTADCDKFTVYYFGNTNYTPLDLSVDGGAVTSVSTVQASAGIYAASISASARGVHTLKVKNAGGNGWVESVEASIGNTGIRVTKVGKGGARSGDLVGDAASAFGSLKTAWAPVYAPDLSVIFMGFNDYYTGVSLATYKANMTTLINKAKESGDVMLVTPYNAANGAGSTTVDFSPTAAVIYELAGEKDCAVLDLQKRWPVNGFVSIQQKLIGNDGLHLQDTGTWEVANALYSAIR